MDHRSNKGGPAGKKKMASLTEWQEHRPGLVETLAWRAGVKKGHAQDTIGGKKKEQHLQAVELEPEVVDLAARCHVKGVAEDGLPHQLHLKRYELRTLAVQHAQAYVLASQH
ncbi:hypothetical protein NDU88_011517 [Pleurodeles waltl]|uniref:Uncharacterized protein n=1 Tax=Pleurodeles waltl TaxID=8319 RepID=A0AAV7R1K7_PLEWA|nr:hypothetical protein NDU88_011517 [Pleurodeles waltl]